MSISLLLVLLEILFGMLIHDDKRIQKCLTKVVLETKFRLDRSVNAPMVYLSVSLSLNAAMATEYMWLMATIQINFILEDI